MSAASRTLALCELLAKRERLGTREISRELGVPIASVHRLLHDLEREHVAERAAGGEWHLSYRILQIAGVQLSRIRLPALARPYLEKIAAETRETTFLAIPSGDEIVYLDMVLTDLQLQLNVELGTRRPMHATGLGKAILAHLSPERQRRFLSKGALPLFTPATITDPILLEKELDRIKSLGYATDREEIIPGVFCIAVPLLNHTNRAVGAMSIAGIGTRQESDRFESLLSLVRAAGNDISMRLGYPGRDHLVEE